MTTVTDKITVQEFEERLLQCTTDEHFNWMHARVMQLDPVDGKWGMLDHLTSAASSAGYVWNDTLPGYEDAPVPPPWDAAPETAAATAPPPAAPPPAAPPAASAAPAPGRQPRDFSNNELGGGEGFAPRIVLDVTPPDIAQRAILAGSNLAIEQTLRPDAYDENALVKQWAACAIRVRKDRTRGWTRKDGSAVLDKNGEQIFSSECTLIHRDPEHNGMEVEIASGGNALVKAMLAVPDGMTVNVVRLPDVGRMMQYRIVEAL